MPSKLVIKKIIKNYKAALFLHVSLECLRGARVTKPLTNLTVQGALVLVHTGTGLRGERGLGGHFSCNMAMLAVLICAHQCKMKISLNAALMWHPNI